MEKLTLGLLAHVDAGKTTLSEQLLYRTGAIRHLGRVDHGDAFLDDQPVERERGITVFSGLASFEMDDHRIYLLDTPGHADFSTEMERAVSVMDAAVLVISCAEGVQSHTETVWSLLESYHVPVLLFLNKVDRPGADPQRVLDEIRVRLSKDTIDLRAWQHGSALSEDEKEAVAALDEDLLERWLEGDYSEAVWVSTLRRQVMQRGCFPVLSGSGLTGDGVDGLIRLMLALTEKHWDSSGDLQAQVFRIRHDENKARVCMLKMLRGSLHVRDTLDLPSGPVTVTELRVYHGSRFRSVQAAEAGDVIAIPGLPGLLPGDSIGRGEKNRFRTVPMMEANLLWDASVLPSFRLMELLRPLEEEEPSYRFEERNGHIACHVMGRIQLEILKRLIDERCGITVDFGPCRVVYSETVAAPCIGIGHYEPLRHYAEVVLRLLPGERGSGVRFVSKCHVDDLALNWQRLIETHVFERVHHGVLTGAALTDVTIELLGGRAHPKHTEGGDFRQSVYRAIRNALMHGESVLLEPIARFTIRCPQEFFGTVSASLARLQADMDPAELIGEDARLSGEAPLSVLMPWQEDFPALTRGRGALRLWVDHEAPCHNAKDVIEATAYNPLGVADESPDSVFCTHGAGTGVAWYKVREWAHTHGTWEEDWQ